MDDGYKYLLSEASTAITYKANNTTFLANNCLQIGVEPLNNGQGKYSFIDWMMGISTYYHNYQLIINSNHL